MVRDFGPDAGVNDVSKCSKGKQGETHLDPHLSDIKASMSDLLADYMQQRKNTIANATKFAGKGRF
jgi:hypothetical protein